MANKYCNLDGSKKIKDEYQKINIGFDKVEEDVNKINHDINTLDERVDEIITTPVEDVSAEEIIDARGGNPTLGKRFENIETAIEELDGEDIKYDNTESGLSAENVQTAIDEVKDELDEHKAESVYEIDGVHGLEIEEGVFTPTILFNDAVPTEVVFSRQAGVYRKIGKRVEFTLSIETSTFTHSFTNESLRISSLPFPMAPNQFIALTGFINRFSKNGYTQIGPRIWSSGITNRIVFYAIGHGQDWTSIRGNDLPSGTNIVIEVSGSYLTN